MQDTLFLLGAMPIGFSHLAFAGGGLLLGLALAAVAGGRAGRDRIVAETVAADQAA